MDENDSRQRHPPAEAEEPADALPNFEAQQAFGRVIEQLRAEPAAEPAADFTLRVMAGISEVQSEMTDAATAARQLKKRTASLLRYLTETPSLSDIALCFLLAGFFYFLLGVIFFLGIQNLEPLPETAGWLRLQPQVAMLTAGVLGTLGLLLLLVAGGFALRLARLGTIAYIGFSVFNGIWISLENTGPFTPIGLLCFTAAPVLLGLFLAASLQRYHRRAAAG
ncbi:MAG: hypothetical protein AMJ54_10445 [Deltaproteobacteria bacterium SG8_13]|nr:MAG: hypothetical protein AMJ54_10445 [Deltaproteobacteria bacterium SG8_13]